MSPPRNKRQHPVIGWREWLELPDLGGTRLKAKIDTGARTSALHAFALELTEMDDRTVASFELHPLQRSAAAAVRVSADVVEFRHVRSSNGREEQRPVIRTTVLLGPTIWTVEVTLTSRDEMGFRMLLGRTAVRRRFLVDPGRSFLQSPRETRAQSPRDTHAQPPREIREKGTQ